MFKQALFITVKQWKQPKYSSAGEWINKTVAYLYNVILLSKKKKKREQATDTARMNYKTYAGQNKLNIV